MPKSEKSGLVQAGDRISAWTSNLFAHPYMQIGVIAFCLAWILLGFGVNDLTAALSIAAITLTQMVLNRQNDREAEDHRRDVAMHAKLDELLIAMKGARDEMAGIEELDEEEIETLKEQTKEAIDAQGDQAGGPHEREAAKAAVEQVTSSIKAKAKQKAKTASRR